MTVMGNPLIVLGIVTASLEPIYLLMVMALLLVAYWYWAWLATGKVSNSWSNIRVAKAVPRGLITAGV